MAPLPPCESPLLGLDRPFAKIRDLAEAALYPSAAEYGLQLTVLLKGSRGVGKFTAVSWVARSLGMHLLEVSRAYLDGYPLRVDTPALPDQFVRPCGRHGCADGGDASRAL